MRERTGAHTPDSRNTTVTRRGRRIRSLALGNAWRRRRKKTPKNHQREKKQAETHSGLGRVDKSYELG